MLALAIDGMRGRGEPVATPIGKSVGLGVVLVVSLAGDECAPGAANSLVLAMRAARPADTVRPAACRRIRGFSMHHRHLSTRAPGALTLIALATLAACGGGGGSDPVVPPPVAVVTRLEGTAAIGAPMAGASITVTAGRSGVLASPSVTAAADGRYSIDVSSLRAPLLVRAAGSIAGESVEHVAVVAAVTAGSTATANVTPLTTAVAALIAPGADVSQLATPATLAAAATAAQVGNATELVVNTLRSDPGMAALLGAAFNPLSTAFAANGTGIDAALERVAVGTSAGNVTISNLVAPPGDNGAPAPVALTPAMLANPTQAPTLPASPAAGDLPSAADLAALGAKWQACLALPIAQRVVLDTAGNATDVLGACRFTIPEWRSNGGTFTSDVGNGTLRFDISTGATVGNATVVLALPPEGHTDPKVFKHPYCNDGPCVVVRFAMVSASGKPFANDWVLGKVNGAWEFVGNQRPFRSFVEARLNRKINMNRDGAAPGNTGDPYFVKDRHESLLRLILDLSVGDTSDIRAVRWTGPGLPAAGVVTFRSQRCGTDDRMAIAYQTGSTRVFNNPGSFQFWTGAGAAEFILGAANLDGTPLATPVPVNNSTTASFQDFTPTPIADIAATVPAWSRYKAEIFRYSNLSDEPDQVLYTRIGAGAESPSTGPGIAWPTLDGAFADAHLKPTGSGAGLIEGFASTLGWTLPAGSSYVSSGYLFSQNLASATNSQNETANYGQRGRIDYLPTAYGDLAANGWRQASPVAGTAMSPSTVNSGTNPNPRCGTAQLPALTSNISDYREVGLFVRGADRQVRQAIWFWDN
jgi:hypothetical protein